MRILIETTNGYCLAVAPQQFEHLLNDAVVLKREYQAGGKTKLSPCTELVPFTMQTMSSSQLDALLVAERLEQKG